MVRPAPQSAEGAPVKWLRVVIAVAALGVCGSAFAQTKWAKEPDRVFGLELGAKFR
jgi:hypothetical protein